MLFHCFRNKTKKALNEYKNLPMNRHWKNFFYFFHGNIKMNLVKLTRKFFLSQKVGKREKGSLKSLIGFPIQLITFWVAQNASPV